MMGDDLEDAYVEAMVDQSFGMPNKRSLREELAELDELEATGVMLSLDSHLVAAARLVERLLPGECGSCKGRGQVADGFARFELTCPTCHGVGRVWDEGIVEAVAKALNAYVNTLNLSDDWDEVSPMGKDQYREQARAVLSAIAQLAEAGSQ